MYQSLILIDLFAISHVVVVVQFAEAVILDLEAMAEESNSRTPNVCFLSMGSDPTDNIERLAKKLNTSEYLEHMSKSVLSYMSM